MGVRVGAADASATTSITFPSSSTSIAEGSNTGSPNSSKTKTSNKSPVGASVVSYSSSQISQDFSQDSYKYFPSYSTSHKSSFLIFLHFKFSLTPIGIGKFVLSLHVVSTSFSA